MPTAKQNDPTGAIVASLLCGLATTFSLDLMPAPQEKSHFCYNRHSPKSMSGEVIGPSVKATTVVLLNGHDVCIKLPKSKF